MAYRVLEVTLVSANDLKKVSLFSRMRVYAVASISGFSLRMPSHSTQVDQTNGCNPVWNVVAQFPIPAAADTRGLALHVRLRAQRVYLGDRDIGELFVPIDDLLAVAEEGGNSRPVSYQVRRPHSGRAHGVLYFCYKFTDIAATACVLEPEGKQGQYAKYVQNSANSANMTDKMMAPPTVYPPPQDMSSAYPPTQYGSPYAVYPPQPYTYAAPPPYRYNAATPQPVMYSYAAKPAAAPARHGGGMGMGLGLGLLGGAVSGMMLGEAIGDYEADAAYDAGFNDALAF